MKDLVIEILNKINFSEKYTEICNLYVEYDKGLSFTKKHMENILGSFSFESKDKSFYKDYVFGSCKVRMTITYKYGFIECFYSIWNTDNDNYVMGRFNSIASLADKEFKENIKYNFPIATSLNELKDTLNKILDLHNDFIKQLEISCIT